MSNGRHTTVCAEDQQLPCVSTADSWQRPKLGQSIRLGWPKWVCSAIAAVTAAVFISIAIVEENFIALAALAAIAMAILFPVEVSLGMFAVLVPFDQILVLANSSVTLTWVAGAFAGCTLLLCGLMTGRLKAPPRAGLYWLLFVLWAAASTVWAIDSSISMERLPTALTLFALYIAATSVRVTKKELSRVALIAIAGASAAALLMIVQFGHHVSHEGRGTLAVGNRDSNPNELAFSLLLPFSLALVGVSSEKSLLKRAALLSALVMVAAAIFLSMSRGGLFSLLVIGAVYLLRVGIRRRTLIAILVLALPLLFVPGQFFDRLGEASTNRGTGRFDIWLVGFEVIKHDPIIGVGLANFPVAYQKVAGYAHVFPVHGYIREAHNMYLSVLAETGVIGFVLLMTAIVSQLITVRRSVASSPRNHLGIALEAACWGQLAAGLSGHIEWSKSFWITFIFLSLVTQKDSTLERVESEHELSPIRLTCVQQ